MTDQVKSFRMRSCVLRNQRIQRGKILHKCGKISADLWTVLKNKISQWPNQN